MKHLLSIHDLSVDEVEKILDTAVMHRNTAFMWRLQPKRQSENRHGG